MLRSKDDSPKQATPSRVFAGVRFILLGFHPTEEANVRSKLLSGGGVDAGEYGPRCTHLIVDKIVYDDSECVVARNDGKTVVTPLWVEHCLDVGMLVDTSSILYRPVKDLNGIPGANSLSICLTGYQRQDRDDIMRMVGLMGAYFSKPLVANKVTHLICYKFEGEKYELAKKLKKIKLVNHRWLEDCLRAWEILPECNYNKSGYELEMMEAEAKDSEEETEDDKNYKVFGGNVAGGPSNLHSGSGVTISKGSEMSSPINKDEAAKKILSDKRQDIVNGKRLVNSPRKAAGNEDISKLQEVNRNQEELTGKGTQTYDKAIGSKQNSELSSNPITARMTLPSDAMTPDALSYSRKIPRRSPASKFSGMLSSDVHATPNGVSEPYNVKDGFDASPPKLEQFKDNTDFGSARNPGSNSKLQFEGGSTQPQKRKISLSNVSSKSPRNDANSKTYASGSPSVRGNHDGLLINRPDILSSSHGIGDNRVEKNDVQSSGSNRSANIPKIKSLSVEKSSLNHGMTFSRTPISDATKFHSDLMMSEKTPETSGLVKFKSTMDAKNEDKEMCSLTHLQSDNITDPGVDQQNTMVSSLRSGNCENGKPASPVDLGADNGSKNETFSRSLTKKKVVKKSLGSKSKLSSGSSKQKGSLCLNKKSIFDDDMFSKEKGKEAEHGRTLGVGDEMADNAIPVEPVIENKVTENTSSENKVVNGVAVEDDETEAPEEDTGAELVNAASEEIAKSVPQANAARETKLEVELSSAIKMKRDIVHRKNTTMISEKVEPKAALGGTKIDEVGGLILNEEMVKGKNNVSSKRKKNAAAVMKKTEKSGKDKVAELKKTIDESKMEVKKKTGAQRPASKLKSKSNSLDDTEVPMNGENDDKLVEKKDLMQGRNYSSRKGMKTLQPDVKIAEVIAKNKMGELAKGIDEGVIDEGTPETENVKMVPHPAAKPKSKTASVVKPQKRKEEEEKENKSVETGSVVANSVKPKESIGTKLNRALAQTNNSVYGTNADQKKSYRASKVVKSEPMCFILSGHRLQRKEFQKIIRCMKGRVCRDSHNWSYEATHFIVPDPIRRTEKFFAAAASGRWILKTDYLTASNQEGKFLPEEPYEWFKKGFSEDGAINLEAPRKWRLLRERTGHGAFYGMRIIIYGECIAPPLDTLKRAVKGGDGVILATAPPYTRYLKSGVDFAVVCPGMPCVDSWVQEFLSHEIPCISADYLVEYVCKPGCSLERHVLFKTEAWADKSYAKMLSRSEEIVEDMVSVEDEDQDQDRNENSGSDDISCQICGSRERAEVMLICGDETGSSGCGIGTHIDCCDPPLGAVPTEDWFCPNCIEAKNSTRPRKKTKKGSGSSKRK